MVRASSLAAVALSAAITLGCMTTASGGRGPSPVDSTVLTGADLARTDAPNALDAVRKLRRHWLGLRSSATGDGPAVYVDGVRRGGIEYLDLINIRSVESIRFWNGRDATTKWGINHTYGAIEVTLGRNVSWR